MHACINLYIPPSKIKTSWFFSSSQNSSVALLEGDVVSVVLVGVDDDIISFILYLSLTVSFVSCVLVLLSLPSSHRRICLCFLLIIVHTEDIICCLFVFFFRFVRGHFLRPLYYDIAILGFGLLQKHQNKLLDLLCLWFSEKSIDSHRSKIEARRHSVIVDLLLLVWVSEWNRYWRHQLKSWSTAFHRYQISSELASY